MIARHDQTTQERTRSTTSELQSSQTADVVWCTLHVFLLLLKEARTMCQRDVWWKKQQQMFVKYIYLRNISKTDDWSAIDHTTVNTNSRNVEYLNNNV